MTEQQIAITIETGAQYRSSVDRDTKLTIPPKVNSPTEHPHQLGTGLWYEVHIHKISGVEYCDDDEWIDQEGGNTTGDPQPLWENALMLTAPGRPAERGAESQRHLENNDRSQQDDRYAGCALHTLKSIGALLRLRLSEAFGRASRF